MPAAAPTLRLDDEELDVESLDVKERDVEGSELHVEVLPSVAITLALAYVYVGVPIDERNCIVTRFSGGPERPHCLGYRSYCPPCYCNCNCSMPKSQLQDYSMLKLQKEMILKRNCNVR